MAKKETIIIGADFEWATMQDTMHNSVVQVVAQIAQFNWLEPYNIEKQFENRGSGFFIDQDHIVTTAHVVQEATTVWIHLPSLGKKAIFVDVIGFCPERDLALLRIQPDDYTFLHKNKIDIVPLPLGDSDKARATEQVLILGYPLGHYTLKSATGVLSGRESADGYSLIQITAPINPGNSGGPLLNQHGEVIGIAIARMPGAQNIGYAIPINELNIILDELRTQPFVRRATLGLLFNYATPEHAQLLNNPLPVGIYVCDVIKNSLFDNIGVRTGDMIYEFNGYKLDGFGDATIPESRAKVGLNDLVSRIKNGTPVSMVTYRNGERKEYSFIFEVTEPQPIRTMYPDYELIEYEIIGGMVIMQLTDNHIPLLARTVPYLIDYMRPQAKENPQLIIAHIMPGSLAQQSLCLSPGFIIKEINGQSVGTLESLRAALQESMQNDLLTLKITEGIFVVFPFKKLLADEKRLSTFFSYPISDTVEQLLATISAS